MNIEILTNITLLLVLVCGSIMPNPKVAGKVEASAVHTEIR